jgi:hypothetical protein
VDCPSLRVDYTEKKKTKRKKENVINQNSLGSASGRASTVRRKTKKTFFVFMQTDLPPG